MLQFVHRKNLINVKFFKNANNIIKETLLGIYFCYLGITFDGPKICL